MVSCQQASDGSVARACNATSAVAHPVLLLSRWDTTNSYHTLEEALSVFVSLAVAGQQGALTDALRAGLQLVVADTHRPGFYMEVSFP